jgi:hypothetical protein
MNDKNRHFETIVSIGIDEPYYCISVHSTISGETMSSVYPSWKSFVEGLRLIVKDGVGIIFCNEHGELTSYLVDKYFIYLIEVKDIVPSKVGWRVRVADSECGYDNHAVGALKESTLLSRFIITNNKKLK